MAAALMLVVAAGYGAYAAATDRGDPAEPASWSAAPIGPLDQDALDLLGDLVDDAVAARPATGPPPAAPARLRAAFGPTYAALRAGGVRVGHGWAEGDSTWTTIRSAVDAARADGSGHERAAAVDAVELCLSHSFVDVVPGSEDGRLLTNVHRGVLGFEASYAGTTERFSPTLMLAQNRSFERTLGLFMESVGAHTDDLRDGEVRLRSFGCDQVLVLLGDPTRVVPMERGNTLVPLEAVSQRRVQQLADDLTSWLVAAVHPGGRMTYKYWPSRGEESDADNTIRQWMATNALISAAEESEGERRTELLDLAEDNIRHNLERYYEEDGHLGLIDEDGKVKLGAVALAALALLEFPGDEFEHERAALDRTVHHLWSEDGSFRTFHRPVDRNDNQNFYPGEALLYWARLHEREPDDELLERFMASFRHYREWHLDEDHRNPAFVPWHTQAYYAMWRQTGDPELADLVLEMNDWLLDLQEWDGAVYPDVRGRFYDADRSHFGPPHASSTGVYLEGLADAYRLALELDDEDRAAAYRSAIRRGLRSILQLQFVDEVDLYYISVRDRARGGVRTTVYDNEIRVDNVQHPLLAVHSILAAFTADDYVDDD